MAQQRGSTWQASVYLKDGRRLRPNGFATKADAELWEAQTKANDEKGLPPPPVPSPTPKGVLPNAIELGELRKLILATPKQKRGTGGWLGSKDYRNAEARSQMACDFFGEDKQASAIDLNEMERYARALRIAGNRPGTINRKLANVSKMLTFAAQRGLITVAPTAPLEEEPEGRIRFLTPEEERKAWAMLDIMGEQDYRMFCTFLIDTGFRFSEAVGIDRRDATPTMVSTWENKGATPRSVPLTKRAAEIVDHFLRKTNGPPFGGFDYWECRATWDRARTRLGSDFSDVTMHIFRHTCCSRLVQGGMDLRRVQVWMGHKDIKTTLRYAHLAPGDLTLGAGMLEKATQSNVVSLQDALNKRAEQDDREAKRSA